jgi:hypothetical protein
VATYSEHSPELTGSRVRRSARRKAAPFAVEILRKWRGSLRRLAWWCPLLAVVLATALLALFGLSLRNAFLAALVLVWLALVSCGALLGRR